MNATQHGYASDQKRIIARLNRIEGQVRGIRQMTENGSGHEARPACRTFFGTLPDKGHQTAAPRKFGLLSLSPARTIHPRHRSSDVWFWNIASLPHLSIHSPFFTD